MLQFQLRARLGVAVRAGIIDHGDVERAYSWRKAEICAAQTRRAASAGSARERLLRGVLAASQAMPRQQFPKLARTRTCENAISYLD